MPEENDPQPAQQQGWTPARATARAVAGPLPGVGGNMVAPPLEGGAPLQAAEKVPGRGLPLSETSRNWTQKNLPMSQEVHDATKPYFELVQNLGREFKEGHDKKFDLEKFSKKHNGAPTEEQIAAKIEQVGRNAEFEPLADALREAYKDTDFSTASPEVREAFEQQYDAIRQGVGRTELSEMEKLLPKESPLRNKLDAMTGAFRDPGTGLYADLKKIGEGEEAKNVLILGGTGVGKMTGKQVLADVGQGIGGIPANYKQAAQLGATLQTALGEGENFETAGHSLGGGLANYVGLKLGVPNTGFNSAALGPGTRNDIPPENLARAKDLALHVNVRGEAISDIGAINGHSIRTGIENVMNSPGKVPGQVGMLAREAGAAVGSTSIGQAVSQQLDSAKTALAGGLDSAGEILGSAKDTVVQSPAVQSLQQGLDNAGELARGAKESVQETMGQVQARLSQHVDAAIGIAQNAGTEIKNSSPGRIAAQATDTVKEGLTSAGKSVRSMLGSASHELKSVGDSLGRAASQKMDGAKEAAQGVSSSVRSSFLGQKLQKMADKAQDLKESAKEKLGSTALGSFIKNDIGIPKGVGAPHQYGQSYEMDVEVAKKPEALTKHLTNTIEAGYKEFAAKANENKVTIGQSRSVAGHRAGHM